MTITTVLFRLCLGVSAMLAFGSLTSCDDDDNGGGGLAEPEIAKGEGKLELSGDKSITIANEGPIIVQEEDGKTSISWTNTNDNQVAIGLTQVGKTGTYTPANPIALSQDNLQGSKGVMTVQLKGQGLWLSKADTANELVKGAINITMNNDSTIAGTISNMKLVPPQGNGSVTVNGEFNASKNKTEGGDPDPDPDPSNPNEAEAELTGDVEGTITNISSFDVTEIEEMGPGVTSISFTGNDGNFVSISLFSIGRTGTFNAELIDKEASVTVNFDGDQWSSEGGDIRISTNREDRITGTFNDVQLSRRDLSATLNGGFDLAKD